MRTAKGWTTRLLSCALIMAMCGIPELVQAQSAAATSGEKPPVQDARAPQEPAGTGTAAAQPAALPDAPSQEIAQAQQPAAPPQQDPPSQNPPAQSPPAGNQPGTPPAMTPAPTQTPAPAPAPNLQTPAQTKPAAEPVGAAAAQSGVTSGGAASKPAGMAIAPAKQRQVRSFLIKFAAIAAGGAAIGTVVALSKGSPSKPPGAK